VISRVAENKLSDPAATTRQERTRWRYSSMNWGNDPKK